MSSTVPAPAGFVAAAGAVVGAAVAAGAVVAAGAIVAAGAAVGVGAAAVGGAAAAVGGGAAVGVGGAAGAPQAARTAAATDPRPMRPAPCRTRRRVTRTRLGGTLRSIVQHLTRLSHRFVRCAALPRRRVSGRGAPEAPRVPTP